MFKYAIRSLLKRKFYTILNVAGLALALCSCFIIYLYTSYHLSFDRYHKDADKTYQLVYEMPLATTEYDKATSYALFKAIKTEMPQIGKAAFAVINQSAVIAVNGNSKKQFKEEKNISFTDSKWFGLFTYQWLRGAPAQLDGLYTLALRERLAKKYFGDEDPIGRQIYVGQQPLTVIGVLADGPLNTDLKADMFISLPSFKSLIARNDQDFYKQFGYLSSTNSGFITLVNEKDKRVVEKKIQQLAEKYLGSWARSYYSFKLLPITSLHFEANYGGPIQKKLLMILSLIGILILTIAAINYINLVIAQQVKIAAETATRKILGASIRQLFLQFISESFITALLALGLAVIMVFAFIPYLNSWLFIAEPVHILSYWQMILFSATLLVAITLATGLYPSFLLSRMNMLLSLKTRPGGFSAGTGRKVMVLLQQVGTQALLICTLVIVLQVDFLKNTDTGFDRGAVVMIPDMKLSSPQKQVLQQRLSSISGIASYSLCHRPPSSNSMRGAIVQYDEREQWESWSARFAIGDSAYIRTFGLRLVAGRNLNPNAGTPEFVINETMAKKLQPLNPPGVLGHRLTPGDVKGIIVGIVKDFNVGSLIEPISPVVLLESPEQQINLAVKLSGGNTTATLHRLENVYEELLPGGVFTFEFVDRQIAALYTAQTLQERLILIAAAISIVISCLGLFGLISLTSLQRTKETGIRKVLGASVVQLMASLSSGYVKMLLLAFAVAVPVSWLFMNKWLQNFAYHIKLTWWMFAGAGLVAIIIALITIACQALKSAGVSPVKSLKSE